MSAGVPCGAHAVTEWIEGTPRVLTWCGRLEGPCPFLGAETEYEVNVRRERAYPGITRDDRAQRPCAAGVELAATYRAAMETL
jgi:hypothetical protein